MFNNTICIGLVYLQLPLTLHSPKHMPSRQISIRRKKKYRKKMHCCICHINCDTSWPPRWPRYIIVRYRCSRIYTLAPCWEVNAHVAMSGNKVNKNIMQCLRVFLTLDAKILQSFMNAEFSVASLNGYVNNLNWTVDESLFIRLLC